MTIKVNLKKPMISLDGNSYMRSYLTLVYSIKLVEVLMGCLGSASFNIFWNGAMATALIPSSEVR